MIYLLSDILLLGSSITRVLMKISCRFYWQQLLLGLSRDHSSFPVVLCLVCVIIDRFATPASWRARCWHQTRVISHKKGDCDWECDNISAEMSLSLIIVSAPPSTCCLVTAHPLRISINQDNSPSPRALCTVHLYTFQKSNHSPLHQNRRCQPVIIFI